MNEDKQVMKFFPSPLSARESDALLDRFMVHQLREGFSVWPFEINIEQESIGIEKNLTTIKGIETGEKRRVWAGYVGLLRVQQKMPFAPAVEISWRLLPAFWGCGYATEAARACLDFGFQTLGLEEIVAFTVADNQRSWRLMERLGMRRDLNGDFDHPELPDRHPLRHHILYRLKKDF